MNKVTPHFTFIRRAKNADTPMHSNSLGCPKICPPSAPVLYWLSHLTCISILNAKNERKTLIYTHLTISRYIPHFFAIFRRFLIKQPPTYLL